MRRSIVKSANVVATLSLMTGVIGTSAQSYGADLVIKNPFPIEVPVHPAVQSQIDQLDQRLRAEFPAKLSASDREAANYIYAGQSALAFATVLAASRIGKTTDLKVRAQLETLNEITNERLPVLESQISAAEQELATSKTKIAVLKMHATNPKAAVATLSARYQEELDAMDARNALLGHDRAALAEIEASAAKVVTADVSKIKAEVVKPKTSITNEMASLSKRYREVAAELKEMRVSGGLPSSIIGKDGDEIANLYLNQQNASMRLAKFESEKATLQRTMLRLSSKVGPGASAFSKFKGGVVRGFMGTARVVGVVGGTIVLADRAGAHYLAYTLGQDPTESPLKVVFSDATQNVRDNAPAAEQALRDAAAEIARQYDETVKAISQKMK